MTLEEFFNKLTEIETNYGIIILVTLEKFKVKGVEIHFNNQLIHKMTNCNCDFEVTIKSIETNLQQLGIASKQLIYTRTKAVLDQLVNDGIAEFENNTYLMKDSAVVTIIADNVIMTKKVIIYPYHKNIVALGSPDVYITQYPNTKGPVAITVTDLPNHKFYDVHAVS